MSLCRPVADFVCCRDMFCAGRVTEEDLRRTLKACGGAIQTSVNDMTDDVLGRCELFEEEQIGGERYVLSQWHMQYQVREVRGGGGGGS